MIFQPLVRPRACRAGSQAPALWSPVRATVVFDVASPKVQVAESKVGAIAQQRSPNGRFAAGETGAGAAMGLEPTAATRSVGVVVVPDSPGAPTASATAAAEAVAPTT
ncbi:MAG: hypothetical protein ACT4QF_00640 [Sporichthyaceae bacterium]